MNNNIIQLIQKYNVPGPRYTSYPTAVQFKGIDSKKAVNKLKDELKGRFEGKERSNLSLYFHIPFCYSLCWYCGCTKIITHDSDRGDLYIDYLQMEMDQVTDIVGKQQNVVQIHFGGGTPTFLRPDQLQRLGTLIRSRFQFDKDVEFSVEIDPRRCTREHIKALAEIGCNRASLGVQDTNRDIQKAIHRIQPYELTRDVSNMLRESGINNINYDLIYGLPKQTIHTFKKTILDVMNLNPDRLAVYSYAHLPHIMPAQKLLDESEFPPTETKLQMMLSSIKLLTENGMRFIGMDHFAKDGDSLAKALDEGTLQRNFQGYSTHAETDMFAFGMSGISQLENSYYQNTKDLAEYYKLLDAGILPVVKKLNLSRDDKIRKDLIMQIMCRTNVNFREFSYKWDIDFKHYFREDLYNLDEPENDGLLINLDDSIKITEKGRLFLRNIAMVFDAYLQKTQNEQRYSKTI